MSAANADPPRKTRPSEVGNFGLRGSVCARLADTVLTTRWQEVKVLANLPRKSALIAESWSSNILPCTAPSP